MCVFTLLFVCSEDRWQWGWSPPGSGGQNKDLGGTCGRWWWHTLPLLNLLTHFYQNKCLFTPRHVMRGDIVRPSLSPSVIMSFPEHTLKTTCCMWSRCAFCMWKFQGPQIFFYILSKSMFFRIFFFSGAELENYLVYTLQIWYIDQVWGADVPFWR